MRLMYEKKRRRLIDAYDLERFTVMKEDGHRYVPWVMIAEVPTADTSQRHGRWTKKYSSGVIVSRGFVCNLCDMWTERKSNYCPYCGAKMIGE